MKFDNLIKIYEHRLSESREGKLFKLKKMNNLSDADKQKLIAFFDKNKWWDDTSYSNELKKIDWTNQNLTISDFDKVLKLRTVEELLEGVDYLKLKTNGPYEVYRPLNFKASKLIANECIGGVQGDWCTIKHLLQWENYTKDGVLIYIIANNEKYAIAVNMKFPSDWKIYNKKNYLYMLDDNWHDDKTKRVIEKLSDYDKTIVLPGRIDHLIKINVDRLK